jgi:23S rRNA pseudouridine1911/1915/1917 synthase
MKYKAQANMPALELLAHLSPSSSKNTLRSWIKEGRVQVDGVLLRQPQTEIKTGQTILLGPRKKFLPQDIEILYEDSDLVVIDKPSSLLSVSTAFEKGDTAHALLKRHFHPRRVFIVHRLDQDTSGIMVFALNERTCQELKQLFAAHDIQRSYTAIVEGKFEKPAGKWESYLFEDSRYVVHETEDAASGERAVTHFKTEKATKSYSWLTLTLETGRKNQIRVHCQSAGHPVVGDKKYGSKKNPIKRLCLHAHFLAFRHPSTKKMLTFESAVPKDFFRLVNASTASHHAS